MPPAHTQVSWRREYSSTYHVIQMGELPQFYTSHRFGAKIGTFLEAKLPSSLRFRGGVYEGYRGVLFVVFAADSVIFRIPSKNNTFFLENCPETRDKLKRKRKIRKMVKLPIKYSAINQYLRADFIKNAFFLEISIENCDNLRKTRKFGKLTCILMVRS